MTRAHTPILVLVAALVGVSVAAAEPSATPSAQGTTPKPPGKLDDTMCPTPDAAKCVAKGYIGSLCFNANIEVCRPFVKAKMKAAHEDGKVPSTKILAPAATEIPRDVVTGKYRAYKPKLKVGKAGEKKVAPFEKVRSYSAITPSETRKATTNTTPPNDRVTPASIDEAKNTVRNQAWIDNGTKITSCEEYAYERNYDYSRYLDSIKACKGDSDCEIAITLMKTSPGIAQRTLKDRNGRPLPKQIQLAKATIPKNPYFGLQAKYEPEEPLPPADAMRRGKIAAEVDAHVMQGRNYYGLGQNGKQKFGDAWGWHRAMAERTKDISDAEREIYFHRRKVLLDALDGYARARDRWIGVFLDRHIEMQIEMPWDGVRDIVSQLAEILREPSRDLAVQERLEKILGEDFTDEELEGFENQVLSARRSTPATNLLAAPSATPSGTPKKQTPKKTPQEVQKLKRKKLGVGDFGKLAPSLERAMPGIIDFVEPCDGPEDWPMLAFGVGPLSCHIRQLLLAEYERERLGYGSCLELGNPACDWFPSDLEAVTIDAVPTYTTEDADLAYCRTWQTPNMFTETNFVRNSDVKKRLDEERKKSMELQEKMGPYIVHDGSGAKRLRGQWGDADEIGDADLFAIGYSYDFGWDAGLRSSNASGKVCEVEGDVHAGIDFSAWLGGRKAEVVDVTLAARVEGEDAARKVHVELVGQQLSPEAATGGNWTKMSGGTTFDYPAYSFVVTPIPSPPPRFDIYAGVPISGEVWGELRFGVDASLHGEYGGCDNPKLTIGGETSPYFIADGKAQVGIGISGIVSVGVRTTLNLLTIELPLDLGMKGKNSDRLAFDSELSLVFGTLSGYVAAYAEFFGWDEEWEIFRWDGYGPSKHTLMPKLTTDVPLSALVH